MSRPVGDQLPERLFQQLRASAARAESPAGADEALLLLTVDAGGWPHPALLSAREVVARDPRTLELTTYGESRTTANLARDGRVTLVVVGPSIVAYVKGRAMTVE